MTEQQFLVPLDEYLKAGIHIGTKFRTKYMEQFIYKVRPDSLTVLNVQKIDERTGIAVRFVSKYNPEDILVVGRRENAWQVLELFSKATGIRTLGGRYSPGLLTNMELKGFLEAKLIIVVDPWPDKNAVRDAVKMGIPVVALCDTNNESNFIDLVVPCNNKGKKSLGLFFWILGKEYLKNKGIIKEDKEFKPSLEEFTAE